MFRIKKSRTAPYVSGLLLLVAAFTVSVVAYEATVDHPAGSRFNRSARMPALSTSPSSHGRPGPHPPPPLQRLIGQLISLATRLAS